MDMQWKPIHSLPPHVYVLVSLARSNIPVVALRNDLGCVVLAHDYETILDSATHWMPLPRSP